MKTIIFLSTFLAFCNTSKAQTYLTRQLSDSMRKQRIEILKLQKRIDSLSIKLESAGAVLGYGDFYLDSNKVIRLRQKDDTTIIILKRH